MNAKPDLCKKWEIDNVLMKEVWDELVGLLPDAIGVSSSGSWCHVISDASLNDPSALRVHLSKNNSVTSVGQDKLIEQETQTWSSQKETTDGKVQ